jgi:hypothetical protein
MQQIGKTSNYSQPASNYSYANLVPISQNVSTSSQLIEQHVSDTCAEKQLS